MAQVPGEPYEPFPDVMPAERVLRPGGVPGVPDAFGVGVGRAVEAVGGKIQKDGQELFQRGLALRKMEIDRQVRDEITNTSTQAAQESERFGTAEGVNAGPFQMQMHLNKLDQIRKDGRSRLESIGVGPYGIDKYDAEYGSYARAFTMKAIQHSSTEFKHGQEQSVDNSIAAANNAVRVAPGDDATFNAQSDIIKHQEDIRGDLRGLKPDVIETNKGDSISGLVRSRVMGMAVRGDVQGAQDILDAAVKNDLIRGDLADKTANDIRVQAQHNISFASAVQTYNDKVENDKARDAVSQVAARNISTDPQSGEPVINPRLYSELTSLMQQNPRAEKEAQERITWAERQQDRAAKGIVVRTNPDTMSGLTKNMFDPGRPTQEHDVLVAETNGQLSHKDGAWLRTIIKARDQGDSTALKDPLFKTASDWAKNAIEGTSAKDRQLNAGTYAGFQFKFLQSYLSAVRDGSLKPGDLNVYNPDSMVRKIAEEFMPGIGQTIINNGGVGAAPGTPAAPQPAPPAVVSPAAAAPTTGPGVSATPAVSLPPLKERVKGQSYMTGKGMMEWTGTGWIAPQVKPEASM